MEIWLVTNCRKTLTLFKYKGILKIFNFDFYAREEFCGFLRTPFFHGTHLVAASACCTKIPQTEL